MYTPVIKTNGEAKIVPHIIQEKLRSTKNKINLHQPPVIAARTSPTVIHMRHVHVAIENAKSLFQNELNQGVASFIPFSHAARTNEFHMVTLFSLANASIEFFFFLNHRRPTEFVHLEQHCPKQDANPTLKRLISTKITTYRGYVASQFVVVIGGGVYPLQVGFHPTWATRWL